MRYHFFNPTTLLVLTLLALPWSSQADIGSSDPQKIMVGAVERSYLLRKPEGTKEPLPLLIFLHGGSQSAELAERHTEFTHLAKQDNFLVVYPSGIEGHWSDGRSVVAGNDDVAFISGLIDKLINEHLADPHRIYVAGASNGGMMAQRIGCELSAKVTAIASVIANMPKKTISDCKPTHPLSVLMINGTDDTIMPWDGGKMGGKGGHVASTTETIQFWAKHNGCNLQHVREPLPDLNSNDHSVVVRHTFVGCKNNAQVDLLKVKGGGHTWPGRKAGVLGKMLGNTNQDMQATSVIWNFFQPKRK